MLSQELSFDDASSADFSPNSGAQDAVSTGAVTLNAGVPKRYASFGSTSRPAEPPRQTTPTGTPSILEVAVGGEKGRDSRHRNPLCADVRTAHTGTLSAPGCAFRRTEGGDSQERKRPPDACAHRISQPAVSDGRLWIPFTMKLMEGSRISLTSVETASGRTKSFGQPLGCASRSTHIYL